MVRMRDFIASDREPDAAWMLQSIADSRVPNQSKSRDGDLGEK